MTTFSICPISYELGEFFKNSKVGDIYVDPEITIQEYKDGKAVNTYRVISIRNTEIGMMVAYADEYNTIDFIVTRDPEANAPIERLEEAAIFEIISQGNIEEMEKITDWYIWNRSLCIEDTIEGYLSVENQASFIRFFLGKTDSFRIGTNVYGYKDNWYASRISGGTDRICDYSLGLIRKDGKIYLVCADRNLVSVDIESCRFLCSISRVCKLIY